MRMRIKIDAVINFKDRDRASLPIIDPNSFVGRGLLSLIKADEDVFIEPGTAFETTLLGPEGRRMMRPPSRRRKKAAP